MKTKDSAVHRPSNRQTTLDRGKSPAERTTRNGPDCKKEMEGHAVMHVTLVGAFNPLVPSAGGSRSYVESLATFLRARGVPHSVIVSGPMYQREGNWCVLPVRKGHSSAHFLATL